MQTKPQINDYTIEDYLHFEETALEKSEYYDGEIFTMAGGTPNHNQIAGNIYVELSQALKKQNYRVYMSDIKVWIPQRRSFNYPDVLLIAGAPQFYAQRKDVLLNPVLIVEVLSDSTQDYDRGDKFAQYRTLTSLQDYILVSQSAFHIEYFRKIAPNEWLFTEIEGEEASLELKFLNIGLQLSDIYAKVDFVNEKHEKHEILEVKTHEF